MALLVDKMITDEFIADVKRDSFLPAVQAQWTHQRILDIAYDEVLSGVAIPLTEIDHSFYREANDITLVAGQAQYDVPAYAMLSKIYEAHLINTTGEIGPLARIDPPDEWIWRQTTNGHPERLRVDGLQIILDPAPTAGDIAVWPTLRTYIYRRPSRLVRLTTSGTDLGRVSVVQSVAATTVTYTAAKFSDFSATSVHDFYQGAMPYRRIGTQLTATGAPLATTQTFSAASALLLTAGSFVALKDETCVVPVPSPELLLPLRQLVIARIHATQGDKSGYETALAVFAAKMTTLYPAASNRLQNNLNVMSLQNSPFVRMLNGGSRMVRP